MSPPRYPRTSCFRRELEKMGTGTVAGGAGGVFLTTLLGTTLLGDQPTDVENLNLPLKPVNVDQSLLSGWLSESYESYSDEPLSGECQYFNFSRSYVMVSEPFHFC